MTTQNPRVEHWLAALDARHLSELTFSEVARALRALSSCYVERRSRLAAGGALDTRGKRAAFALFYGPLHFFVARRVLDGVAVEAPRITHVLDLGCGTGAAGAAWALRTNARVTGVDRNAWAVSEANWTYRELGVRGRARQADAARVPLQPRAGTGIMLAYVVNEIAQERRSELLRQLLAAAARGARVLVIEPISRRIAPWWTEWTSAFDAAGGRSGEWRFPSDLPARQRELAKAAGLDPRELTARSLWL